MRQYRPNLIDGPDGAEQSFTANVVAVEEELVAFGDLLPDEERSLPHGTPVHSLLIHLGEDGPELFEFNDQGNTVECEALARTELGRDRIRFVFHEAAGPWAGRVSLGEAIEVFEDEEYEDAQLGALTIVFDVDAPTHAALRTKLAGLL